MSAAATGASEHPAERLAGLPVQRRWRPACRYNAALSGAGDGRHGGERNSDLCQLARGQTRVVLQRDPESRAAARIGVSSEALIALTLRTYRFGRTIGPRISFRDGGVDMPTARTKRPFFLPLGTILLAASLAHASSNDLTSHGLDHVTLLHEDSRILRIEKELAQNPNTSYRLIVPDKCEAEGEADLRGMAAHDGLEESYVFVPSLCLWIEVGQDETRTTARFEPEFIGALLREFPAVAIYHTHPAAPVDIAGYFPAYTDLVSVILVNLGFVPENWERIAHRAVTTVGTIEYTFVPRSDTARLIEHIERTGLGDFVSQNVAYAYASDAFRQRYYSTISDCSRMIDGDPARLGDCFPLAVGDFLLEYRSAPEPDLLDLE